MKTIIEEIAYENHFELIDTTDSSTGYPSHLKKAIIGFDSFEEAESLAKEHGLAIKVFTRRDGWDIWYRTGNSAREPFERSCEDYGADYMAYTKDDQATFFESEVQPMIADLESFDDMRGFLDNMQEIYHAIEDADDDELVITYEGHYYETIKKAVMEYTLDTHHYAIGLIDRNN